MRDLFFVGFLLLLIGLSFKRPYVMALAYIWVDLVSPQRLSYYFLSNVPIALVLAIGSLLFFLVLDDRRQMRFGAVQSLMMALLLWTTATCFWAEVPEHAWVKWDWVWKSIAFGIFLPFVMRTRQRIEMTLLFMVCGAASLTISGGAKTILGGGGYNTISFLLGSNSGLFEGSTLATVGMALVPLIIYLYNHSMLFPKTVLTLLTTCGLVLANVLITVGSEARTGLVAGAALALLMFIKVKRKLLVGAAATIVAIIAVPLLPQSFTERMSTIKTFDEDSSASGRVAVWKWTLDYIADNPLGGGFGMYRINQLDIEVKERVGPEGAENERTTIQKGRAKAFHSSYFEVLGEHGYPGLMIYMSMLGVALLQLLRLRIRFRHAEREDAWIGGLAYSLIISLIVYMVGSLFIGIAFQPMLYLMLGISISLTQLVARRDRAEAMAALPRPRWQPTPAMAR